MIGVVLKSEFFFSINLARIWLLLRRLTNVRLGSCQFVVFVTLTFGFKDRILILN